MRHSELLTRLTSALEPEACARGFELVAVEQSGGRGMPVLRVLLDREGGVDLDAIASASGWVGETIESSDPFGHPYTLEVSSPGIDRPLTKAADFARFAGENVQLKTEGVPGRSSWTGELLGIEDDQVMLDVDGERVGVSLDNIVKARLKGVVDFGKGKGRSA